MEGGALAPDPERPLHVLQNPSFLMLLHQLMRHYVPLLLPTVMLLNSTGHIHYYGDYYILVSLLH